MEKYITAFFAIPFHVLTSGILETKGGTITSSCAYLESAVVEILIKDLRICVT